MKIAVVGAGLAGLAVSLELARVGVEVTLFDEKGVGVGASATRCGLLHAYPPLKKRQPVWRAREALAATLALLKEVGGDCYRESGIERIFEDRELANWFWAEAEANGDVDRLEALRFLIRSGVVVDCTRYLPLLWRLCEKMGVSFQIQKIFLQDAFEGFDQVVFAMGGGMLGKEFDGLKLRYSKGQELWVELDHGPERAVMGWGHLVPTLDGRGYMLGSTYELGVKDAAVDLERAKELLLPKLEGLGFGGQAVKLVEGRAALRVLRGGSYYPVVDRLEGNRWVFTALGSRGLLYHAYLAKLLAGALIENNSLLLPQELLVKRAKKE